MSADGFDKIAPFPGVEVFAHRPAVSFEFEDFADLELSPQTWLVKKVLPRRGVAFIAGKYATGKSFLASDLAVRVAAGREVFGRRTQRSGVIYVAAEDDEGIRARFIGQRLHHGLGRLPIKVVGEALDLLDPDKVEAFVTGAKKVAGEMEAAGTPLGLVVFDVLSCCIPGVDENNSQGMSQAFDVLKRMSRDLATLVLAVAHFGKSGADKGIRGWSGLDSNSYATITLELNDEDPELRIATIHKVKNAPRGDTYAYRLEEVGLGLIDEDGDEVTTCVPAFEDYEKSTRGKAGKLTPNASLVLEALGYCVDHGLTVQTPTRDGIPRWAKSVSNDALRTRTWEIGFADEGISQNTLRQRYRDAKLVLKKAGLIQMEGEAVISLSREVTVRER